MIMKISKKWKQQGTLLNIIQKAGPISVWEQMKVKDESGFLPCQHDYMWWHSPALLLCNFLKVWYMINSSNVFVTSLCFSLIFSLSLPSIGGAPAHLVRCVAVIHGVFQEEVLEHAHSQLSDLGPLLQGLRHLSQQQSHQEVVPAVLLRQAELQTLLCGRAGDEESVRYKRLN